MPSLIYPSWALIPKWVWLEFAFRALILVIFIITEHMSPYTRVVQPEEYFLYKFPSRESYVPSPLLWVAIVISSLTVIALVYGVNRDVKVLICALAVPSLALPLNGIITNLVKVSVGRFRPDYFNRCYGEAYLTADYTTPCIGSQALVMDGRKSFPSGHSSMSFCGFGFIFLFVAGQLRVFSIGRGRSAHLVICALPLLGASLVAISRTCDYHHHWQDVSVGSILGFLIVFLVYRQYFPCLADASCDQPDVVIFPYEQGAGDPARCYNTRRGALLDNPTSVKTV